MSVQRWPCDAVGIVLAQGVSHAIESCLTLQPRGPPYDSGAVSSCQLFCVYIRLGFAGIAEKC